MKMPKKYGRRRENAQTYIKKRKKTKKKQVRKKEIQNEI